jgi:hypothetical protein
MIILNAATHREHWYPEGLEDHYLVGVSDTGYSNNKLAFEWIKHFDRFSQKRIHGQYRLLLLDGHESYQTTKFIEFCNSKKIIPFYLPPYSTYFL